MAQGAEAGLESQMAQGAEAETVASKKAEGWGVGWVGGQGGRATGRVRREDGR